MSSMERCYCLQCVLRSDATVYNVSWGEWNSCLQCVLRSDSDVYSVMNINNAMPVYLSTYLPVYLSSCIHIYLSTEKEKASLTVSATNTLSENIFHFQIGFKITGRGGYCIWYTGYVKQYPKHCQVILYCSISNSASVQTVPGRVDKAGDGGVAGYGHHCGTLHSQGTVRGILSQLHQGKSQSLRTIDEGWRQTKRQR